VVARGWWTSSGGWRRAGMWGVWALCVGCQDRDSRSAEPPPSTHALAPVEGAIPTTAPAASDPDQGLGRDPDEALRRATLVSLSDTSSRDVFDARVRLGERVVPVRLMLAHPAAPRAFRGGVAYRRLAEALGVTLVPPAAERSFRAADLLSRYDGPEPGRQALEARLVVLADGSVDAGVFALGPGMDAPSAPRRVHLASSVELVRWSRWAASTTPSPDEPPGAVSSYVTALVLDYLAANVLRGEVLIDGEGRLILDDNLTAFPAHPDADAVRKLAERLRPVQRFPRALHAALRDLDEPTLREALAPGSFDRWLVPPRTWVEVLERQKSVLSLIDARVQGLGADVALSL
jgi:hypothetical protein